MGGATKEMVCRHIDQTGLHHLFECRRARWTMLAWWATRNQRDRMQAEQTGLDHLFECRSEGADLDRRPSDRRVPPADRHPRVRPLGGAPSRVSVQRQEGLSIGIIHRDYP